MTSFIPFFLFLFLASLAEILPINLPKDAEVTVGFAVFMGAILVLGTKASVWLAFIAAVIPEIKTKRFIRIPYNSFVNISIYIIMVGVSGYLFEITGGTPGKINILNDIIPMLVLVFSYLIMNISLIALALSILQKK